jgi:hypothetical protein
MIRWIRAYIANTEYIYNFGWKTPKEETMRET